MGKVFDEVEIEFYFYFSQPVLSFYWEVAQIPQFHSIDKKKSIPLKQKWISVFITFLTTLNFYH